MSLNSLTYLLYNAKQGPPPRFNRGLIPGQQINRGNPISITIPLTFGREGQAVTPLYGPIQRGSHDPIVNSEILKISRYELGSAGNWPLKLTKKQIPQIKIINKR